MAYFVVKRPGKKSEVVETTRGFEYVREVVGFVVPVSLGDMRLALDEDAGYKGAIPNIKHPQHKVLYNTIIATEVTDGEFEGTDKETAEKFAVELDKYSF